MQSVVLGSALVFFAAAAQASQQQASSDDYFPVWPPPRSASFVGSPRPLHPEFKITTTHSSPSLADAVARYSTIALAAAAAGTSGSQQGAVVAGQPVQELRVEVPHDSSDWLGIETICELRWLEDCMASF